MHQTNFIVLSNPVAGREEEFNQWYTNQHLPDLLAVPSVVSAQRFVSVETGPGPKYAYLAIYEIGDADRAIAEIAERRGTPRLVISPAFDTARSTSVYLRPVASKGLGDTGAAHGDIVFHGMNPSIHAAPMDGDVLDIMLEHAGGGAAQLFEKTEAQARADVVYAYAAILHVKNATETAAQTVKRAGSIAAAFLTRNIASENRFVSFYRPITGRITKS